MARHEKDGQDETVLVEILSVLGTAQVAAKICSKEFDLW